ncbi:MAG: aminotransferase class I/II-fold pyridoxal phosphate-dependent enzyme [Gammaproteobacteria bacterium]|nr:aminotransferase class I/II-fold pyridoxal phosphate-dependent enzyme [Gammaproteobacteria bacterium]
MSRELAMDFQPFAVEQFLSENEHAVRYNFSESGVHPLSYHELFNLADINTDELFNQLVDYPQVNGFESLREVIASRYAGATAANVLVTVGASEANALTAATLLEPRDNLVRLLPTYEQLCGDALNLGFEVRNVKLHPGQRWEIDELALCKATDQHTRILHVVNPNNPTGSVLTSSERTMLINCAGQVGAWLVADEVYIGTERDTDQPTPSFWGKSEQVIIINSMSKAYGLPGLRIGWVVAPEVVINKLWRRHEYAVIAASRLSMRLAEHALRSPACDKLNARTRQLVRRGFNILQEQLATHTDVFSVIPPQASAMSFVQFRLPVTSEELAKRLLREEDVLVLPGSRFGMENYFRFSSALEQDHLLEGLSRLNRVVGRILAGR